MRPKLRILLPLVLGALMGLGALKANAQDMQDSSLNFSMFGFQYSFDMPVGYLSKSFGPNSTIGASFWRKTKNNLIWGIEYNYVFSDQVKINPLDSINTAQGYLINSGGQFADVTMSERGHFAMFKIGKIFPGIGPNPSSGLFVKGGIGFWLHQIYYYWNDGSISPQLSGNYMNGYDRLSYGPAFSESFGYLNFSNNKKFNFSAELEFAQGITTDVRGYDYDTRQSDTGTHLDMTIGMKIAWYFPIYKRAHEKYYY